MTLYFRINLLIKDSLGEPSISDSFLVSSNPYKIGMKVTYNESDYIVEDISIKYVSEINRTEINVHLTDKIKPKIDNLHNIIKNFLDDHALYRGIQILDSQIEEWLKLNIYNS